MATVQGANAYDARGATERLCYVPGRPGNIYPPVDVPWEFGTVRSGQCSEPDSLSDSR